MTLLRRVCFAAGVVIGVLLVLLVTALTVGALLITVKALWAQLT